MTEYYGTEKIRLRKRMDKKVIGKVVFVAVKYILIIQIEKRVRHNKERKKYDRKKMKLQCE